MFRKTLNRAVVGLKVTTRSPLLIRTGDTGLDPSSAELSCVRTRHAALGSTVYVPGSSAKGVIRSAAEASIRGFGKIRGVTAACDPLDNRNGCGGQWSRQKRARSEAVYQGHCLACRLFGSTALRGRCAIRDLFPFEAGDAAPNENFLAANRTELRNGVGIDRIAGSVKVGPFDFEMVPAGVWFAGDIALTNVQAWQIGLLAAGLRELDEGFAQLGSTKSRGLGVVSVAVDRVLFEQTIRGPEHPVGVGHLTDQSDRGYGLLPESTLRSMPGRTRGLSRRFELTGAAANDWLRSTEDALEVLA